MAKVWNTVYPTGDVAYTKSAEDLLTENNIPFTVSEDRIHFITHEWSVDVSSREYDKPHSLFCMQLCDTVDGTIGMGEASLSEDTINIIGQVFGESEDLEVNMSVSSSYGSEEKTIFFEKNEDGTYRLDVDVEDYDEFEYEDDEEEWE